jgi:hypothetical protein
MNQGGDMSITYGVKDRDGTVHDETSKKEARRSQKAYGGLVVQTKNGNVKPYKPRRVFLWVFLAIQAAFIIWLVAGTSSAGGGINASVVAQCHTQAAGMGMTQAQCVSFLGAASKAGTGLGAALVVILWVVVDFLLAVSYGIYRLARR